MFSLVNGFIISQCSEYKDTQCKLHLTVLLTTQKGSEKTELESEAYSVVSFSAPSKIASSKSIAVDKHVPSYFNRCIYLSIFLFDRV